MLSTSSITIRFNRFLLPGNSIRQAICLRADLTPVTKLEECGNSVFLAPTYDPIRREITFRQRADQPRLIAGTTYKLTVLAPVEVGPAQGIRAFDRAPLLAPRSFEFKTAANDPAGATLEELPSGDLFCRTKKTCVAECAATTASVKACEVAGACDSCAAACMCDPADPSCTNNCPQGDAACDMACKTCNTCQTTCRTPCADACPESVQTALRGCAFGSCHAEVRDPSGALMLGAAMGLDLSTPAQITATAINKVAHLTQQGEHADEIDRSPLRFGRAIPIIDAKSPDEPGGAPGNSFLLYKLAVGASAMGDAAPSAEEVARLRASVVAGMPMPPLQGSPLKEADLKALVTWIAQGAPTPTCP